MGSLATVSPRILGISWGMMEIEGLGRGRDFKLWPGGGRPWDWGEYGTGHFRGIQIGDVEELLDHGAKVVVLTQGVFGRLKVPASTRTHLKNRGITVEVASTKRAVELYNGHVAKGTPVGGLFHSTC